MHKDYGVASYGAVKMIDGLLLITAEGVAPNLNTRVTLELLPWKIWPPRFGLFFESTDIVMPAMRPFSISGVFLYPASLGDVTIIDANGHHVVKIGPPHPFDIASQERANSEKAFNAYQQIGVANCMIAPVDAMVPMIFRKAHGPDTYKGCEAWVASNCGKA